MSRFSKFLIVFAAFLTALIVYDKFFRNKPFPAIVPLMAPVNDGSGQTQRNLALNMQLATQLMSGRWAVVVILPVPQRQTDDHDSFLRAIVDNQGALHALHNENVTSYQYVDGIDKVPDTWRLYTDYPQHLAAGKGELAVFEMSNKNDPRLVYQHPFPYTGVADEYKKDWTSSQIISLELAKTVSRWNAQANRPKQGG